MSKLTLCYSPRTTLKLNIKQQNEMIEKICLSLDKLILDNLKQNMKTKSLNQEQFIDLMTKNLHNFQVALPNRQIKLYKAVLEMFHQITIGKELRIYWNDLADYFISKARQAKVEQIIYNEQAYIKAQQQPKIRCQNKIQKCIFVKSLSLVLYSEQNSNVIEVLNSQTLIPASKPIVYQAQKFTVESSSTRKNQGKTVIVNKDFVVQANINIIDFIYISSGRYNLLMCSLSNGLVTSRAYSNGVFVPACHPDNDTQALQYKFDKVVYCMQWDPNNETLCCGCENDTIYKWSFKTSSVSSFQCASDDNLVTCLANIPKLQMMASGSMDGKLILWDTVTNFKKHMYKEHNRGILTMVFSELVMLLFTAGFDHTICVWNPYVQGIINKISTHLQSIIQLSTYKDKLIAMDQRGNVEMYNIKTFALLNQLVLQPYDSRSNAFPSSFCVLENPHKLLICSHRIAVFAFELSNTSSYSQSNNYTTHLCYFNDSLCLLTAAGQKINKWSMLTGDLEKTIKISNGIEINAIEFDAFRSLIYAGIKSSINVYNSKNMLKIRQFPSQPSEVNLIKTFNHLKKDQCIAVVEGFVNIHVYKETFGNKYELLKQFSVSKQTQITFITYNLVESNLIIGTNVGVIGVYDIETGRSIANSSSIEQNSEIINLHSMSLNSFNILIQVTKGGIISLVEISPNLNRIYSCQIKDCQNGIDNQRINCSDIDLKALKLFIGDEKGFITCYGIRIVCDQIAQMQKGKQQKVKLNQKQNSGFQKLWMFKTHHEGVICLQFVKEAGYVISSGYDRKIRIRKDNGQYLNEFKTCPQQHYNPIFYVESFGSEISVYNDYLIKKKLTIKKKILFGQQSVFDPNYFVSRVDMNELTNTSSNSSWKVHVDFNDYVTNQRQRYRAYAQRTKKYRPHVQKTQMLPKLRQNLEKSINDSLKYIFSSEEGKNNMAIQSSFMYQPKLSHAESLPRISQSLKVKRVSRHNLNNLSKPRLKGLSHFAADKPKVEALSKQAVEAYNKLNSIIENSYEKGANFTQVKKRY